MNTRPPSQHEALTQEELELARVVRALPGGEPPSALDALILKAATDAVASSGSPKKTAWGRNLLGTSVLWIGTAAASILTVGVGWQVFQSMRAPIYELPADENVSSVQETDSLDKNDSLVIEMTPAREPAPTSPPPSEAFAEADQAADAMASAAAPEANVADIPEKQTRARQENADAAVAKIKKEETARQRDSFAGSALLEETSVAAAPAPPPPAAMSAAPMASTQDAEAREIDSVNVTGSKLRRTSVEESGIPVLSQSRTAYAAKAVASIDEDAKLPPAQWLDAIKARIERQDIDGAKASLKRYRETHPTLRVPEELKFLLK